VTTKDQTCDPIIFEAPYLYNGCKIDAWSLWTFYIKALVTNRMVS